MQGLLAHELYVNFRLQRQGKQTNLRALFSIFIEKKVVQVGFEPMAYCFQGSCSTNRATCMYMCRLRMRLDVLAN